MGDRPAEHSGAGSTSDDGGLPPPPALRWTWTPHREQPARVGLAAALLAATAVAVGTVDPWLSVLGTALLAGTLADGLFPTRYTLGPDRATSRGLLARRSLERTACRRVRGRGALVLLESDSPHALIRRRRDILLRGAPPDAHALLERWRGQSADSA